MQRLGVVGAIALVAMLAWAGTASAAGTLALTKTAAGSVADISHEKLACGLNCTSASYAYPQDSECVVFEDGKPCQTVYYDPTVTLEATPEVSGVSFAGWSGACSGTATTCDVTLSNSKTYPVTATFNDDADPAVSLNSPVSGTFGPNETVSLSATASDNVGVTKVEYYVGAVFVGSSTGGGAWSSSFSTSNGQLADGTHSVVARAYDASGRTKDSAAVPISIDKRAPAFVDAPSGRGAYTNAGTQSFAFVHDEAVPQGSAGFECKVDGSLVAGGCTSAYGATTTSGSLSTTFTAGTHTVRVTTLDRYGTAGSGPTGVKEFTFTVDQQRPTLSFGAVPTASRAQTVTIPYTADGTGSPVTLECRRDTDGGFTACPSPTEFVWNDPPEGRRTLSVRATDAAGNEDTFQVSFDVDRTGPQTTITAGPQDGTTVEGSAATFEFAAGETGATFACRLYAQGAAAPEFGPCSGPGERHEARELAPGTYVFAVVAADALGNRDATPAERTFTIAAPRPAGSGATGGGGTLPPEQGVANVISSPVFFRWTWNKRFTVTKKLTVEDIPAGAAVHVICKGRGCPFKSRRFATKRTSLSLTKALAKRKLRVGTVLEVRILKQRAVGKVLRFTIRKNRIPKMVKLCLKPGLTSPTRC